MVFHQGGRVAVVSAEGRPFCAVGGQEGKYPLQVGGGAALARERPHPQAPTLLDQGRVGRLVVGLHAGQEVGLELLAGQAGSVPIPDPAGRGLYHRPDLPAGQHAGVVHDLSQPLHARFLQQSSHVGRRHASGGRVQGGGGDAGRYQHAQIHGQAGPGAQEEVHRGRAQDVRELVRLDHGRRHSVRSELGGELRRSQEGALHVDVRVDEPGEDHQAVGVDEPAARVAPHPGDDVPAEGDVGRQQLPGEDGEDPPPPKEEARGFLTERYPPGAAPVPDGIRVIVPRSPGHGMFLSVLSLLYGLRCDRPETAARARAGAQAVRAGV